MLEEGDTVKGKVAVVSKEQARSVRSVAARMGIQTKFDLVVNDGEGEKEEQPPSRRV